MGFDPSVARLLGHNPTPRSTCPADTVRHEPLIDLLKAMDVDSHNVQILANLYWKQKAAVRHNGEIREWISICLQCTLK